MSWYNDDLNNGFIDTTQDFVGGGGGYILKILILTQKYILLITIPNQKLKLKGGIYMFIMIMTL